MGDKIKDSINHLIDEFGLYEAKNMLGITFADIVKLSGQKIYTDTGMAPEILYESINNGQLPIKYKEFEISTNSDGVVYWEGKFQGEHFLPNMVETIWVMATPFWDGMKWTPVETDWYSLVNRDDNTLIAEIEGGGDYYEQLEEVEIFSNVDDLFSWYKKVYLPSVYEIIIDNFLPKLRQDMDDRLDENEGYSPMRESIVRVLREETKDEKETLKELSKDVGLSTAAQMVGGIENFVNIAYDGDIKEYFKQEGVEPYSFKVGDNVNMYLNDLLVEHLNLKDYYDKDEKELGDFRFGKKNSQSYKFTARLRKVKYTNGNITWRVVGMSGSQGFGYSFMNKRDELAKTYRKQIFQQIIDKYNLDSYK